MLPRVLAVVVAAMFVALAVLNAAGVVLSLQRLHVVPSGRQRHARMIVVSGAAGVTLRILVALVVMLATYDPEGRWRTAIAVALGAALLAVIPGLGVYLWRHHEPWIQEWRGGRTSFRSGAR
jgi:hypothetical protein